MTTPPRVVLVHGAFVDGSGWQNVYDLLVKDGYPVTVAYTSAFTAGWFPASVMTTPPSLGLAPDGRPIRSLQKHTWMLSAPSNDPTSGNRRTEAVR